MDGRGVPAGEERSERGSPEARRAVRRFLLLLACGLFIVPLAVTPWFSGWLGVRVDDAPWLTQWCVEYSDWALGRTVPHHIPGAPFVLFGAAPISIFLSLLLRREYDRPALSGAILAIGAAPLLLQVLGIVWGLAYVGLGAR